MCYKIKSLPSRLWNSKIKCVWEVNRFNLSSFP